MGALFAIVFFLFLLVIGVAGIVSGSIGLIVCRKKRKTGKSLSKTLNVVFIIVLSIGITAALVSAGFFSFIFIVNAVPPEGYVETDIVIEENGYQDTCFTADGVVYEVLDFQVYDFNAVSDPVFAYKTEGFLNGSQCGNYYKIDNRQGFRLVSDEFGLLFAPVDEKERVIAYYTDAANLCGYYEDRNGRKFKLSDTEYQTVQDFLNTDVTLFPQKQVVLEDAEEFEIKLICKDGIVYIESYWFLILSDKLYYVYDSDFAEDEGIEYTLIEIPNEFSHALLTIYKND